MDKIYSHISSIFSENKLSQEPVVQTKDKHTKIRGKAKTTIKKQTVKIVLHIYKLL